MTEVETVIPRSLPPRIVSGGRESSEKKRARGAHQINWMLGQAQHDENKEFRLNAIANKPPNTL